jgi:hypothetical protein
MILELDFMRKPVSEEDKSSVLFLIFNIPTITSLISNLEGREVINKSIKIGENVENSRNTSYA